MMAWFMDGNIIFLAKPTGDEERRHASGSAPVESVLGRPRNERCVARAALSIINAWCALANLSINNTYLRPGITPAVDDINTNCSFSRRGRSTAKVTSNTDGSFYAHNHQEDSQKRIRGTATSFDCSSSSSPGDGKLTSGKVPWVNNEVKI
ncbi:hypothetical protein YC2023_106538 [Brassica napus]